MKVLQIINALNLGGAQKLLADSIVVFHKKGWKVDLFPLDPSDSHYYEIIQDLKHLEIIKRKPSLSCYNPMHIIRIARVIKNYDIIHVHLFPALYWVSIANIIQRKNKKGRCLIYTEHNTNNRRRNSLIFRLIDRIIYKQFNYIVAISEGAKIALQKHLGNSYSNLLAIDNGIDLDLFKNAKGYSKKEIGFTKEDILIIQASRLMYPKDPMTIIKAIHKLDNNKLHLLLAGEGPSKEEIIRLAKDLNLTNNIHLLGNRNDIPRLLKTVDIVILSSAYEGLSLASVEGMVSGKPFIASDVPGLTEVVGGAGLLFPLGDSDKLASILYKLIEDEEHSNSVVQRSIQRAHSYDINKMMDDYIEVYKSCSNG